MWYLAELAFAEPESEKRSMYLVETSKVLFEAASAIEAYARALEWAEADLEEEGLFPRKFLGVTSLSSVFDTPGDGAEIAGSLGRRRDVWRRRDLFVPLPETLGAIAREAMRDQPVGEAIANRRGSAFERHLRRASAAQDGGVDPAN